VLVWAPDRSYDVWHDRAVFHFLTADADRDRYVAQAEGAVRTGGSLILGTFAEDGPPMCSGLPVARYAASDLAAVLASGFALVSHQRQQHITPGGTVQPFTWAVLQRAA
jgi:hypothetical protein